MCYLFMFSRETGTGVMRTPSIGAFRHYTLEQHFKEDFFLLCMETEKEEKKAVFGDRFIRHPL